uniref:RE1-silencing transcription factor n=1 Tax=Cacopsylla melanoneura TaxID=428564 RepID=A0A8D8QDT4_9HEMI
MQFFFLSLKHQYSLISDVPTCSYCCSVLMRNAEFLMNHGQTCLAMNRPSRMYRYMCYTCDYHSYSNHNLLRHVRIHLGEKPFKCSHCDYFSSTVSNIKRHMLIRHNM